MRNRMKPITIIIMGALLITLPASSLLAGCKQEQSAAPQETAAPVIAAPPEDSPAYWPYTGLAADDPELITRRPLSVKIENSDFSIPQTNVIRADIVYETMIEGGETRFNCIYQSDIPDEVGDVRSARLSDVWIVPQYNAMLFYSGSNREVDAGLARVKITNMSVDHASAIYYRSQKFRIPHNLFLRLNEAYAAAAKKNIDTTLDTIKPLAFGDITEAQESRYKPVKGITIPWAGYSTVTWTWSETEGKWLREQAKKAHNDAVTGKQLFCDTIAIMTAKYTVANSKDPAGAETYDCTLGGEGPGLVLRDGKMIECTWKADKDTPPTFTDTDGNPVLLKPGTTWFEVPPTYCKTKVVE